MCTFNRCEVSVNWICPAFPTNSYAVILCSVHCSMFNVHHMTRMHILFLYCASHHMEYIDWGGSRHIMWYTSVPNGQWRQTKSIQSEVVIASIIYIFIYTHITKLPKMDIFTPNVTEELLCTTQLNWCVAILVSALIFDIHTNDTRANRLVFFIHFDINVTSVMYISYSDTFYIRPL